MNVSCDKCRYEFEAEQDKLLTTAIKKKKIYYFECNACKHKYIVRIVDDYIEKEIRKLHKIGQEYENDESLDDVAKALLRVKYETQRVHLQVQNNRLKQDMLKVLGSEWQ